MKTEKFKNLFGFAPKSSIKAGDGLEKGNFPFYTSSQKLTKRIDREQHFEEALIFGTGGIASVHFADEPFSTSTDCLVAISINKEIKTKFVYYYLFGNIYLLERGFKGAGLKHISKRYIENLDIPILPIETQNKIVAILDKASSLIKRREENIELLNELLKSAFLKMFGKQNPLFDSWEEVEVQSLAKSKKGSMRTGPFGSSLKHEEFNEAGEVAVLGIDNAVDNVFRWGKKRFLTQAKYEKFKQYTVYPRDVIITIMGTVGRSAVIPIDIGKAINTKHLAAITLDETKCNPYYLAYSVHSNPFVAYQMKSKSRGAIMDGFNLGLIKRLKLKATPIDLQNKFEEIFLEYGAALEQLNISKSQLENLLSSVLQKVFNGTINFNDAQNTSGNLNLGADLSLNIDFELELLIKEISLLKKSNDLSKIENNPKYLKRLIEKLNNQEFKEKDLYDRAKHGAFQLMAVKEEEKKLIQKYEKGSKSLKLRLK
jgi:type I restriction enzyme S subunit